jgi:hypothetical protein
VILSSAGGAHQPMKQTLTVVLPSKQFISMLKVLGAMEQKTREVDVDLNAIVVEALKDWKKKIETARGVKEYWV